ncbi:uncharacterized protein RCO7_10996 [Rhynchosporium graminicola]|uniref:ER membrane protein complex subunit 6 n=1 Tax=Rhynchosporium graminicola TaxID=2792576 RepID=A0A1E1LKK2_9HELO|nr:uncharacterized protein RCO7_10996 [Rhynchosporium commune]
MPDSKSTPFLLLTILTSTALSLSIPAILPPIASLKHDKESNKLLGAEGITFGCAASLGIGALFASIFLVWFGLVIYHSAAALFVRSDDLEELEDGRERRRKENSGDKMGWTRSCTAGSVLGTIFGLIFAIWGALFVWNMFDAVGTLRDLAGLGA